MFQQIIQLLPHQPGNTTLIVALVGSLIGLVLWFTGARLSRVILTLIAVAMGTAIGMKSPVWFHWSIDPMAPGVGLALILGLSAYALHRYWVGASLGILLTAWAALGAWTLLGHDGWHPPTFHHLQALPSYFNDLWDSLPGDMHRWLPYLAAASLISSITLAAFWPRFGAALFWSAFGTSLMLCMGSIAVSHWNPDLLDRLPRHFGSQLAALGVAVTLGMLFQWWLLPRTKAKTREKSPAPEAEPQPTH